jgi:hypothetical protein
MAYSANGAESRSLLDPAHAGEYDPEFAARSNALARIPPPLSVPGVVAAAAKGSATPGFTGFLADELNNITFDGEREAAVQTLKAWESYMAIDAQIRTLERASTLEPPNSPERARLHLLAVELCIGTAPGQSNWAFEQFDRALQSTLDINKNAFDAAVAEGFLALRNMEYKAAGAAALIAILIALGLGPRIREYE